MTETPDDEFPLSDREYAFGWLVLGLGMSRFAANNIAAVATYLQVDLWAKKQKTAIRNFRRLIIEDMDD